MNSARISAVTSPNTPSRNAGLYRQAAINAAFMQQHGKTMLLPSIHHAALYAVLILICASLAVFVSTQGFQQKASVTGYLQSTGSDISITSKESTGVVKAIHVSNADIVEKGAALLTIERNSASVQGENAIEERSIRLQNEGAIQSQIYAKKDAANKLQLTQIQNKISAIQHNITLINNQIAVSDQQLKIARDNWHASQQLAKQQLIALSEQNNAHMQLLSLQQNHDSLQFSYNQQQSTLQDAQQQLLQTRIDISQTEHERALYSLDLQTRLQNLQESAFYTIYAPTQGEVNNLYVKPGDNLSFQQALLQLLPTQTKYEAILHVPNAHIGFVEVKQKVDIKLDAFSYEKYGRMHGEVSLVSKQIHSPSEASFASPNTFYIVKVRLFDDEMQAKGQQWPIKSGMALQANIILGEPSLLEWLLAPVYNMLGHA